MKQQSIAKVDTTLGKLVEEFKTGDIPEKVAILTFPPFDVPSNKWSLSNRVIMMMHGTSDARGFRQWGQEDRQVKKGSKAFHILGPQMIKTKRKNPKTGEEEEYSFCRGFFPIPVFRVEDTDGEKLDYEKIELPELPLKEKAEQWGISVNAVAFQGDCYGYFQWSPNGGQEAISLATPEEKTFFHELSHAAHKRIKNGKMNGGQDAKQEIVAELSAQVLCRLVGKSDKDTRGNTYEYIKHYAEKMKKNVGQACVSVLSDVEKVLKEILS